MLVDTSNRNSHFVLITGDFNAKSRNWSTYDTTTLEGDYLDSHMTLYDLNRLISEPKHILKHSCSCIDLFSPTNQILSGTLEYILLFTESAITRSFTPN